MGCKLLLLLVHHHGLLGELQLAHSKGSSSSLTEAVVGLRVAGRGATVRLLLLLLLLLGEIGVGRLGGIGSERVGGEGRGLHGEGGRREGTKTRNELKDGGKEDFDQSVAC